jgi:1,4-dihydroxy-2-naphthoate polyprenyltransferase
MQLETSFRQPVPPCEPPPGKWAAYLRLCRPHTLTASFVPVLIGTVYALSYGHFRAGLFGAMFVASILIQIATNIFNEYYDYKRGLDDENSVGIAGSIINGGLTPRQVLAAARYVSAVALLLGLYLSASTSWWLLPIGLLCIAAGYFYSGGPFPLSATPLGELVSGLLMGLVIITISFFILTGVVTAGIALISVPTSILIGAILMANNIRDLENDKKNGRHTLAILLQKEKAVYCLVGMFAVSYAWIVLLVSTGNLSPWSLLSFASLPKAIRASRVLWRNTTPRTMMPGMVATAQTNTIFGLGLTLGLILQYWRSFC